MTPDSQRRRLLKITAGNLRQHHLYVNRHYDFFPADVVGGAKRSKLRGSIELWLDGLNETVTTDIGSDAKTGESRGFLRCRSSVRRFFEHHNVTVRQ
jgi:hypothetical protein